MERESRSINLDNIPSSNNEIESPDYELHNKRKYYDNIHPTKTTDYLYDRNDAEIMHSSGGFGDKFNFQFPGEAVGVPRARALPLPGPRIRPSAVQPMFATADPRHEVGRQNNAEIQNIITGIVKLLNGNVNVQANTQLLGRPNRPMASRINNRGPPRISDVPPLPPDFDKPVTPPVHAYHPTKTPPPYPFDRPPHHGVNLPEQIVPPVSTTPYRPGLHRPNLPPWHRPRPRPTPGRRPPNLPVYKPTLPPLPFDIPIRDDEEEDLIENNSSQSDNNVHSPSEDADSDNSDTSDKDILNNNNDTIVNIENEDKTTTPDSTTSTSTTTTTTTTTTEKPTTLPPSTTESTTTEKPETTTSSTTTTTTTTTTEKPKPDKLNKIEKDKKKDSTSEKDKIKDKHKINESEKLASNKTIANKTESIPEVILEPSILERPDVTPPSAIPTPVDESIGQVKPTEVLNKEPVEIETSSINTQPISSTYSSLNKYIVTDLYTSF